MLRFELFSPEDEEGERRQPRRKTLSLSESTRSRLLSGTGPRSRQASAFVATRVWRHTRYGANLPLDDAAATEWGFEELYVPGETMHVEMSISDPDPWDSLEVSWSFFGEGCDGYFANNTHFFPATPWTPTDSSTKHIARNSFTVTRAGTAGESGPCNIMAVLSDGVKKTQNSINRVHFVTVDAGAAVADIPIIQLLQGSPSLAVGGTVVGLATNRGDGIMTSVRGDVVVLKAGVRTEGSSALKSMHCGTLHDYPEFTKNSIMSSSEPNSEGELECVFSLKELVASTPMTVL